MKKPAAILIMTLLCFQLVLSWSCATFKIIDGSHTAGNGDTAVSVATTLPYTPPARVIFTTPLLMLSTSGPASGELGVEIRDGAGNLLDSSDYHLNFHSTNPHVTH